MIRNDCWSSKEKLFKSGVSVHHLNAKMFYNLGNVHRDKQQFHEAKVRHVKVVATGVLTRSI